VEIADKSAVVNVPTNMPNGGEGCFDAGGVVYGKKKSCKDLNN